jgi:hypothetical protein
MSSPNPVASTFISLADMKDQLAIDQGITIHDRRIEILIGAAIDWAENFTQRSLGEMLELDSPTDSSAVPLPDPKDSPGGPPPVWVEPGDQPFAVGGEVIGIDGWTPERYARQWEQNPIRQDDSKPRRRDLKSGIMLMVEILFDKNVGNMKLLQDTAETLLHNYRIGMGV